MSDEMARQAAIELERRLRRESILGWLTIGIGVKDEQPCLYLYWEKKTEMRRNSPHVRESGGLPVCHRHIGKITVKY